MQARLRIYNLANGMKCPIPKFVPFFLTQFRRETVPKTLFMRGTAERTIPPATATSYGEEAITTTEETKFTLLISTRSAGRGFGARVRMFLRLEDPAMRPTATAIHPHGIPMTAWNISLPRSTSFGSREARFTVAVAAP